MTSKRLRTLLRALPFCQAQTTVKVKKSAAECTGTWLAPFPSQKIPDPFASLAGLLVEDDEKGCH